MGVRNYLVEGVSGAGKTSVCHELRRRGHDAVNGDTDLAYQGDPATGLPTDTALHEHHLWDVRRVSELVADDGAPVTFFCGGSRNFAEFTTCSTTSSSSRSTGARCSAGSTGGSATSGARSRRSAT